MPGNTVSISVRAEDSASKVLKDVGDNAETAGKHAGGLGSALADVGKIAGGFVLGQGISQAPAFLFSAAKAAAEDEQSVARLTTTLKTLSGNYDDNLRRVNAAIGKGQDLAFTDDDLRDSFDKLAQATGSTDEALKRQQIAMDLARGAGIPLADASKLLGKVTDDNLQVFKKMGITLPDVASEADVLAAVQAKFAGQATAYADSTAGQFEKAQNNMGELKESLGKALLPAMVAIGTALNEKVIPALQAFAEWWDTTAKPAIAAFFAWLQPKLAEFLTYYDKNLKPFVDAAIAGISSIVQFVTDHWHEIMDIVQPVLDQLQLGIQTAVTLITAQLQLIIDLLHGDFSGVWADIQDIIGAFYTFYSGTIGNMLALLQGILGAFEEAALAIGSGIVNKITEGLGDLVQFGKDRMNELWSGAMEVAGYVLDWAEGLGGSIADKMRDGFRGAINAVIDLINGFINAVDSVSIPGVHIPDWVPEIGGNGWDGWSPNIPQIGHLAKGGIVDRPTLALIGEAGPEAVVPLNRAGGAGLGEVHIHLEVNAPVYGYPDFEARITSIIKDAIRGGGFRGLLATG